MNKDFFEQLLCITLVDGMRNDFEVESAVIDIEDALRELLTYNDFFELAEQRGIECQHLHKALLRQADDLMIAMKRGC